jgi:hypothetical protein
MEGLHHRNFVGQKIFLENLKASLLPLTNEHLTIKILYVFHAKHPNTL